MQAVDFKYDNRLLSDLGMEIVHFDGSTGFASSSAGSTLNISTIAKSGGRVHSVVGAHYDDVFMAEIDICKPDGATITMEEYRFIMHWLNRKEYHELIIMTDLWSPIHFNGTFDEITKVEHCGRIVGFTLHFTSNAPFGFGTQIQDTFYLNENTSHRIEDNSDERGDIPFDSFVITCGDSGDLELTNAFDNRKTVIKNCTVGEVITINGKTMTVTSSLNRNVYDDFNFVYPMLSTTAYWYIDQTTPSSSQIAITESLDPNGGTIVAITTSGNSATQIDDDLDCKYNDFSSTLPCSIVALYTPIRKVVF